MGLYDRDYSRDAEPGFNLAAPTTAVMQLLAATIAVYVAQLLFETSTEWICLFSDWWKRPWEAYRLVTYGFAHDPNDIKHIVFNMFGLVFFGKYIEQRYGRSQFLIFYLGAVIFAGLVWSLVAMATNSPGVVIGASGAITAIFVVFALCYPHVQVLFMFVIPMPAWVLAMAMVAMDAFGALSRSEGSNVAYVAHLAGAMFGLYYYRMGSQHAAGLASRLGGVRLKRGPKLRVHEPEEEEDDLTQKVDAILEKIQAQGQDSLTWSERRLLQKASKKAQEKRR
jgi:membrane associated rhomboid family serine protease